MCVCVRMGLIEIGITVHVKIIRKQITQSLVVNMYNMVESFVNDVIIISSGC